MCNRFEFGGYLHHALAPRVRPYVDGRMVSAYPVSHLVAWLEAHTPGHGMSGLRPLPKI